MRHFAILLTTLCTISLFAQQEPPPCSAVPGDLPCGLTVRDLDQKQQQKIAHLEERVAAARAAALESEIDATLIELEAERLKVAPRDLYYNEIIRKTAPVTEDEYKKEYDSDQERYGGRPMEQQRVRLAAIIADRHRAARAADYSKQLRARYPVVMKEGSVLATVGPRSITAAQMATPFAAAEYNVRFATWRAANDALVELKGNRNVPIENPEPPRPHLDIDTKNAASRGDIHARVTVIEFGDFQCPPCGQAWNVVEEALKPYGDRVHYVFVNNPLPIHEHAMKAAQAATAAQEQGKFHELADLMFHNQSALDDASLKKYASMSGLDVEKFAKDLDSDRFAPAVIEQKRMAQRYGANATPIFFINGVRLPNSAITVEGIRAAVDAAEAGSRQQAAGNR